jgi:hypothetical protein
MAAWSSTAARIEAQLSAPNGLSNFLSPHFRGNPGMASLRHVDERDLRAWRKGFLSSSLDLL